MKENDVYVPPLEREAWSGPGAYPNPSPVRGRLVGITVAPDGTLDIEVEAPDKKLHRFSGCYIQAYSSHMSAEVPGAVCLEDVSLISSSRNAPPIQVRAMTLPVEKLHGVNAKVIVPLPLAGDPNKNGDDMRGGHDCKQHEFVDGVCAVCHEKSSPLRDRLKAVLKKYGWPDYMDLTDYTYEPAYKLLDELVEATKESP